jgi:hypothetical protein
VRRGWIGLVAAALAAPAGAQEAATGAPVVPATLAGHAILPALTLIAPPEDAPRDAWISGKFTGPARADRPMSVPGDTGPQHGRRPTGISLPFVGQPLQGFSGFAMTRAGDGSIYVLTDNGFGAKRNSADALLFFSRIAPDFETGAVEVRETVFLRDPDKVVPFRITHEGTAARYLTGADFDPESIQIRGEEVWIGEEFGPYLIRATLDGRVTGLFPTIMDGEELRSVDHPAVQAPAVPGEDFRVTRSSGYEGMAITPDGSRLWAMLEKPILTPEGEPEGAFLRVLGFDPDAGAWTGESFRYPLDPAATAIGDFNFVDATRALVIERDNGEGDPSLACAGDPAPDCFPSPARFKRVVLIDVADRTEDGTVRKIAQIDLMDIADPEGRARLETDRGEDAGDAFTFPFFTIENVMAADDTHLMVAVDNNLPFSSGRRLDRAADNEIILLAAPEFLAAR